MKKNVSRASVVVLLISMAIMAQEPATRAQGSDRTIVFDIEVLDFSADIAKDLEKSIKERGGKERLIGAGKLKPIAALQIRARAGETASARLGQRVPVQTASISQPAPQVQYENTGLNVDIRPSILADNRIQVGLKIELSSVALGASTLAPTFLQRTFSDNVNIRPDETVILLSAVQHGSLWPPASGQQATDAASGNFVVLLTARTPE